MALAAVHAAADGHAPLDPRVAAALLPAREPPLAAQLSDREKQVLRLVASGLANKQIARRLGMARSTVREALKRTENSRTYDNVHFSLPLKFAALVAQPFAMRLVVRKHTAHLVPKRWRMIGNFEVGQFMHSDVVDHLRR